MSYGGNTKSASPTYRRRKKTTFGTPSNQVCVAGAKLTPASLTRSMTPKIDPLIDLGGLADATDEHLCNLWVLKFGRDWVLDSSIEKDTYWHALLIGMMQRDLVIGRQVYTPVGARKYKGRELVSGVTTSWKIKDADR